MKPPKCRLCGAEHALGADHVFSAGPSRVTSKESASEPRNGAAQPNRTVSNAVSNGDADRVKRWRAKGPNRDRYNAQQRERMRLRRAARRDKAAAL